MFAKEITEPSNYRSFEKLNLWLEKNQIVGVAGVDTRASILSLRNNIDFNYQSDGAKLIFPSRSKIQNHLTTALRANRISKEAYTQLMEETKGAFSAEAFNKLQKRLYDQAFDHTGLLTDKAAKHASQEIALNLDNDLVNRLNKIIEKVHNPNLPLSLALGTLGMPGRTAHLGYFD